MHAGIIRVGRSIFCACFAAWWALWVGLSSSRAGNTSTISVRLDDPRAVYLTPGRFPVLADGVADDSDGLQEAIDQVATNNPPGILFVPEGFYRLSKTVYVWPGVRLIGYGESRPTFLLGENTPEFQEGDGKYMLFFSGGRGRGTDAQPRDGNPGTFYSALSNIDIEIREGNAAAVGIRFHVAQHCFLSHMEFRLGSARAGLEDIGNVVEDVSFIGGQYGIVTGRSAPGWPILLMACTFEGQSVAAINSKEGGLTIVRPHFKSLPVAVEMAPGHADQLWMSDALLEDIDRSGFKISREHSARTQINLQNLICTNVPTLVEFGESGKLVQRPEDCYVVDHFSHGLHLGDMGSMREIKTTIEVSSLTTPPVAGLSDIPSLPTGESWVNVRGLGVKGDGTSDDTAALKEAIATHRTLYLPLGVYRVSDTLKLRPDTVLVGLHPAATVIHLPNDTPGFQDAHMPRPVIEAPDGGSNIVSGLGVYAGPLNPAAVEVKWMAGEQSMMNDVRLHGGHGTRISGGIGDSRGSEHRDRWGTQFPSLWVTDGGGGIFKNIWTPSPYASAGMLISNTSTRGRVYGMSVEHHVSNEMIVQNASDWHFYALQFEEEREEGPRTLPLLIENSSNLLFANTFFYRVVSSFVPQPYTIGMYSSSNVHLRNVHVYSNSKVSFDNSVFEVGTQQNVRDPDFALLDVMEGASVISEAPGTNVLMSGRKVKQLADGFFDISGVAVDSVGDLYFADPRKFQLYRWSVAEEQIEELCKIADRPEQLAFDKTGNLLIVAYEGNGTVFSWNPEEPDTPPRRLDAQPAQDRPGLVAVLPVNRWMGAPQFISDSTRRRPFHFVSPDGSTFIPAGGDFAMGTVSWGTKLCDLLRAFRLAPAESGKRFYVCNEAELQTWSFAVNLDGTLSDPQLFVEEGGESVVVDETGRVYIAAGQVRVFGPAGQLIENLEVPQKPTCLAIGGTEKRTLFIAARSALYSVDIQ